MKYEVLTSGREGSLATIIGYREMKGETRMNKENVRTGHEEDEVPQEKLKEGMTVEEMCKIAVAGKIKPPIDLLNKAIGTPWELDLKPDGSVKFKHNVPPTIGSDDFKEDCFALRAQIEETKIQTMLVFREHRVFRDKRVSDSWKGEIRANLMLAYRHLEDARMRLGKAIQAFDGGESCYPR